MAQGLNPTHLSASIERKIWHKLSYMINSWFAQFYGFKSPVGDDTRYFAGEPGLAT